MNEWFLIIENKAALYYFVFKLSGSQLFDKEWDCTQSGFYSNRPMLAMTKTSMIEIVTLAH